MTMTDATNPTAPARRRRWAARRHRPRRRTGGRRPHPRPRTAGHVTKVACVGDSITFGAGTTRGHNYPTVLGALLGPSYRVANFGNSGKTMMKAPPDARTSYWSTPTFLAAQAFAPDVVVLMLGTNDTKTANWRGGDNHYADDLRAMLAVLATSAQRLLATLPAGAEGAASQSAAPSSSRPSCPPCAGIAALAGMPIIDVHGAFGPRARYFGRGDADLGDGVHPNDAGARLIAETIARALQARRPALVARTRRRRRQSARSAARPPRLRGGSRAARRKRSSRQPSRSSGAPSGMSRSSAPHRRRRTRGSRPRPGGRGTSARSNATPSRRDRPALAAARPPRAGERRRPARPQRARPPEDLETEDPRAREVVEDDEVVAPPRHLQEQSRVREEHVARGPEAEVVARHPHHLRGRARRRLPACPARPPPSARCRGRARSAASPSPRAAAPARASSGARNTPGPAHDPGAASARAERTEPRARPPISAATIARERGAATRGRCLASTDPKRT